MNIERRNSDAFVENKLPDGSRVLVNAQNESVFALNTTAGAAWDACKAPTTIPNVIAEMQRSLGSPVTEELAQEAISRLEEQELVHASGSSLSRSSRRKFMMQLGTVAVPLVVAMTMSEQRAYAQNAQSFSVKSPDTKKNHHDTWHQHKWW